MILGQLIYERYVSDPVYRHSKDTFNKLVQAVCRPESRIL